MYVETMTSELGEVFTRAYPEYNGKKHQVEIRKTIDPRSYWSGGSRSYFRFLSLSDKKKPAIETPAQSAFDKPIQQDQYPLGGEQSLVCVEHSIVQGKDFGLTLHVHPEDVTPVLQPPTDELTSDELIVLTAISTYKNSYGGKSNIQQNEAQRQTGISPGNYQSTKQGLVDRKYLGKRGNILPKGRNAIEDKRAF